MKLLLATRNRDKVKEIEAALNIAGLEIVSAADLPDLPDVIEDADTLAGNAEKKARECARFTGLWSPPMRPMPITFIICWPNWERSPTAAHVLKP
jgi:hypothetical protein